MPANDLYKRIRAEIEGILLIDTHEHLISEHVRLGQSVDLFHWFAHYASSDLIAAGMPDATLARLRDTSLPLEERWAEFAPHWRNVRNTGYGRALLLAAQELYEVRDINEATYRELSEKIRAANQSGLYHQVLKERARVQVSILDPLEDYDPTPRRELDRRFFAPVFRVDDFITPCSRLDLQALSARTDIAIHSLDDLLRAMDVAFQQAAADQVVAVKVAVAYERPLAFEKVTKADAERVFNQLSRYPFITWDVTQYEQLPPVAWHEAQPLQDYLMHQAIRRAIECGLPVQIHTGFQEGNANFLANAQPLQLVNLFIEYPEARFDLFHAGYPFQGIMATLGKNFPNVYLDLCWVHVISPWVARQTLHEWIETVPASKIFAFGGDYIFVEGAYAHSRMARSNVAEVLTEKVESGYLNETEAINLAHLLLRDNALHFFQLPA